MNKEKIASYTGLAKPYNPFTLSDMNPQEKD